MSAAQAQHAAAPPLPPSGTGLTVRAPRVFVVNQQHAAPVDTAPEPLRVRRLLAAGAYRSPPTPAVIVYRIESGTHRQTGVLVEVSVEDYRDGRIRRHEATQPARERRVDEITEAAGVERMPVTLLHADRARLRSVLSEISSTEPDVHVTSGDGVAHTVWICPDTAAAQIVQDEIGGVGTLYIADGHHRMAAAQRHADRQRDGDGAPGEAFTLAALFPRDEMRVLGYHRCVALPSSTSSREVLEVLAAQPAVTSVQECAEAADAEPGVVVVRLDGRSYRVRLRTPPGAGDVRASLDVVAVDEQLLPAVTGLAHAHSSGVSGHPSTGSGHCWCGSDAGICFQPHPPSVEQVMAVADAGMTMPPKSTWFDPKVSSGLFLRELT